MCREHAVDQKVVFVPSRQIGHNLGTALAIANRPWVNLHLTTTSDWAYRLAGPTLSAEGWKPVVRDAEVFFLARVLQDMAWPKARPPENGVSAASSARMFVKTIRALRLANVRPDELATANVLLSNRRIIVDLYSAYCTWLQESRLFDEAHLYQRARSAAGQSGIVAVMDETTLPETAWLFVTSLSDSVFRIGRSDYGLRAPQHSGFERLRSSPYLQREHSVGAGGAIYTGGIKPGHAEELYLREATGEEGELRGVLREYVQKGIRLDEIELAYTSEKPYLPLIVDLTERLDIPASFASGLPVTMTRPGQSLLGFFEWMADGLNPATLVRLLRSRLLCLPRRRTGRSIDPARIAGCILKARIMSGRKGWVDPIDRLQAGIESLRYDGIRARRSGSSRDVRVIGETRSFLSQLYALVPVSEQSTVGTLADAGIRFLAAYSPKRTKRDQLAAESLTDRLRELVGQEVESGTVVDLASVFIDLISAHKVEASVARPGHLYVVPLERAGYTNRRETAIVGLSETTFPGAILEDPVLLDDERSRLSGRLTISQKRTSDPGWHFARLLGMAAGRVILTASRIDLIEGREAYPCALFEQLRLELGDRKPFRYDIVPRRDAALTDDEAAMAMRFHPAIAQELLREKPWLGCGLEAVRQRASSTFGVYDGWLGRETAELRPGAERAVSASRLEELAACPYRYFLRHVLDIQPPDTPDDRTGRWLTPLEFGSLLHEVLKLFMEQISARGEFVDVESHAVLIEEILDECVHRYRERIPVRREAGYQIDIGRLRRAVRIFLAEESRRRVDPVGFEVSFGLGETAGLAAPDPVLLELGEDVHLLLRGVIDRIDKTEEGYEVWDYKSGSAYDFEEVDMLTGGRRLQWALYAHVLDALLERAGLEGATQRSGYFFPGDREHGVRLAASPLDRSILGSRIAPLLDLVEKGAFLHVQKHRACTYCDYSAVCSAERKDVNALNEAFEEDDEPPFRDALSAWMNV